MTFITYRRGWHVNARESTCAVHIGKQTRLTFSKLCTEWLVQRGTNIELLWDKEIKRVAFKPSRGKTINSYPLHVHTSQSYVSARAFIQFVGSPPDGVYAANCDDELGIIYFDLGGGLSAMSTPRRNAKSWFVWLIEYRANNGGWYPCSRGSFSLRKDAEKAIKHLFGQEVGYRAAKYVREPQP